MQKWYEENTHDNDVVISGKIRYARNLRKYCFDGKLKNEAATELVNELLKVKEELEKKEGYKFFGCNVDKLSDLEKASMVECQMISPMLSAKNQSTGLILSEDEGVSLMFNEEEHVRIQSFHNGLNIKEALSRADRVDDIISENYEYAFDDRYGYLTTSSTNVGTGLRATYMLFLPALSMTGKIQHLTDEVAKYGAQIRGAYGDGTKSLGDLYQISNQKTLGCQESEIIENLTQIVKQAVVLEMKRRDYLLNANIDELEDKVYRSYGVLKYAKKLNTMDAMTLLAQLKFGIDTNIIKMKNSQNIVQIMREIQPANIQRIAKKGMGSAERDHFRAEYVNKKLDNLV